MIEDKVDFWDQLPLEDQEAINEVKDLIRERFNFLELSRGVKIFTHCH